ncbi:unnamed protein product, partial [Rotaria magnacalcarata]
MNKSLPCGDYQGCLIAFINTVGCGSGFVGAKTKQCI